jgi:hypothetical protein
LLSFLDISTLYPYSLSPSSLSSSSPPDHSEHCPPEELVEEIDFVLKSLPPAHLKFLELLVYVLVKVVENDNNKMDLENVIKYDGAVFILIDFGFYSQPIFGVSLSDFQSRFIRFCLPKQVYRTNDAMQSYSYQVGHRELSPNMGRAGKRNNLNPNN